MYIFLRKVFMNIDYGHLQRVGECIEIEKLRVLKEKTDGTGRYKLKVLIYTVYYMYSR